MLSLSSTAVRNISTYTKISMKVYERELPYLSNWWTALELLSATAWKPTEEPAHNPDDITPHETKERIPFQRPGKLLLVK